MLASGALREARDRLVQLGLEADLASVYLHLLVYGTGRPGMLALALHTSRADVYRRLERLVERGLAIPSEERPVVFRAAEPSTVFRFLLEQNRRKAEVSRSVQEEMEMLADKVEFMQPLSAKGTVFRHLNGRSSIYDEIHRLIDTSYEEILIVNTHPAAATLAEQAGLWDRLLAHAAAGIRFRLILSEESDYAPFVGGLPEDAARVIPFQDLIRFVVVDRSVVLLGIENDASSWLDSPLERAVITDSPGFLASYLSLFDELWQVANPLQKTNKKHFS